MSNIMNKRGFISNAERNKNIKKLDKGNGGRKFVMATALIIGVALAVYILIGILGQKGIIASASIEFINGEKFTTFGYIAIVLVGIELIFGFIGFFLAITMMSAKEASHRAVKLSKIALPGKKNSRSAAKNVSARVTQVN